MHSSELPPLTVSKFFLLSSFLQPGSLQYVCFMDFPQTLSTQDKTSINLHGLQNLYFIQMRLAEADQLPMLLLNRGAEFCDPAPSHNMDIAGKVKGHCSCPLSKTRAHDKGHSHKQVCTLGM